MIRTGSGRFPLTVLVPALLALGGSIVGCTGESGDAAGGEIRPDTATELPQVEILNLPVDLYFPTEDGGLVAEPRELPPQAQPIERIRAVVEAVLAGPRAEDRRMVPPLPEDVALEGVYLGPDGVAFLDLRTPEPREPPPMGSREEMQVVYSLVNSVVLNVAEARRVVVLWNGRQRSTFAGHLDTSSPLGPDTDLVVR